MQMGYFGDSFDIVKQSMLGWLRNFGEWSVHPMFTEIVSPADVAAFERLLGAKVVSTDVLKPETDRRAYFACAASCGNLFLDPDTGLRIRRVGGFRATKYLFGDELVQLADGRPGSLTLVFDQSLPRGDESSRLRRKLSDLRRDGLSGFAYVSHACFVLVGRDARLVRQAWAKIMTESRLPESRFLQVKVP